VITDRLIDSFKKFNFILITAPNLESILHFLLLLMGVTNLWKLVESTKENVLLDVLDGKRVAVDTSIWLYHFLKARPNQEHAPLIGFISRICKLLIHDIKP
jgi:hypothetical protein